MSRHGGEGSSKCPRHGVDVFSKCPDMEGRCLANVPAWRGGV